MSNSINVTADSLADLFIGEQQGREILDQGVLADFAKKHGVRDDLLSALLFVLENVSQAYWLEVSRARRDKGSVRKELNALLDSADQMRRVLSNLGYETVATLREAKNAMEIAEHYSEDASIAFASQILEQPDRSSSAGSDDCEKLGLPNLEGKLDGIVRVAELGLQLAFAGQKGKPPDDSALTLAEASHLVWTNFVGREYRIDWNGDDPISDAAVFSFDLARIVDPEISAKRVRTSVRKARENPMSLNDLSEFEAEADNIRKRLK